MTTDDERFVELQEQVAFMRAQCEKVDSCMDALVACVGDVLQHSNNRERAIIRAQRLLDELRRAEHPTADCPEMRHSPAATEKGQETPIPVVILPPMEDSQTR